jgi:hypothetical protein
VTRNLTAYFYTAQDARRAMNQIERLSVEVSEPEPTEEPVNGRAWALRVELPAYALSDLYPSPSALGEVMGAVLQWNGSTQQPV